MRTLLLAVLVLALPFPASAAGAGLAFRQDAGVRDVSKGHLAEECPLRIVEVSDPYYGTAKRYHACPLAFVLAKGFGTSEAIAGQDVLLRAADGYTRSVSGDQLLLSGVYLAFSDAEHPDAGFHPIDRRQLDPAPFYMIWEGEGRSDTSAWPWPYQLVEIEIAPFARQFPHTVPTGAADDSPVQRGFELFRRECFSCHAINGEGGKIGPDLNVPQSITAYRPEAQIRAFIRDPQTFRYTTMPSHEHLRDADLDDLLAYLERMSTLQHDPGGSGH